MKNSLVSIIIPAYKAGQYIEETVQSVLAQTHTNFELIIVDDGSPDDQASVIEPLAKKDDRIQYIKQENGGVASARNHGYRLSKGTFLAFLDADDVWMPTNIEEKLAKFESDQDLGLVHSDANIIDSDSKETGEQLSGKEGWLLKDLLGWEGACIPAPSSILVKRSVVEKVGDFCLKLSNAADQEFFFRVAKHYKIGRVAKPLWQYRVHSNNMHSNIALMEKDALIAYQCAKENKLFHSKAFERYCFAKMYKVVGASWWGDGKNKTRGSYFLVKSFLMSPSVLINSIIKNNK